MSPYFIATVQQPLLPMDLVIYDLKVPATEDFLKDIKKLWKTIYQRETHQAIQNKTKSDKAWRQSIIQVGEFLMLSICHLVLKAVTRKLKPRILGTFWVEAQVGANTFKLTLPGHNTNPVFNVLLLQLYQRECMPPGPIEEEGEAEHKLEKIIQHCGNGRRW